MVNRKSSRFRSSLHEPQGLDVWQRLTRLLAVLALLGLAVLGFSYFVPEWEKLGALQERNARLEVRRDQLLAQKAEKLDEEKRSLTDPAYLEIIARDRLNMQLPGETVIRIDREGRLTR
jgi:cell division protein FtsB